MKTTKMLTTVGILTAALPSLALMEPATPESQGVSSEAILRWIDACEKSYDGGKSGAIHGFVIVRHGKVIAEGSWKPFDTLNETHMLYSHSKSFTSTAVGLVVADGKLDLDEHVVDIFSNEVPAKVSENLAQLRVRDLLTMNAGKDRESSTGGGDWVRAFLSQEFVRKPGTRFKYDSDATYMLAALVEKKTGRKLMDYLKERVFDKIGIVKAWTTTSPQGIACGGWGMNMTTRELARFGQLYLNRGVWEGERVFPAFWEEMATSLQTLSGAQVVNNVTLGHGSDWDQGYGFQFWRCLHGCYRADGAYGQYTVVSRDRDLVVSLNAGLMDMGGELGLVWEHILPAAKDGPLPENPAAVAKLRKRCAELLIKPVATAPGAAAKFKATGRALPYKANRSGIEYARLDAAKDGWLLTLKTPSGEQKIPVGRGRWAPGSMRLDTENYEKLGALIGVHKTMASGGVQADGSIFVKVYLTGDTAYFDLTFGADGKAFGDFWSMGGAILEAKE